ncbi:MAG: hypothetical protein JRD43_07450 [Deltaproteobacteria bacterium]|nr:hypothetical protein [Deltaproteobacteria bacterium]MBW2594906.1 hypothetical protein [Deltaproteobacteria bacterium]
MGLVARFLETEGFSTIALTPIPEFQRAVGMARVVGIEYPFGRPVGQVHDAEGQREVLLATLSCLEKAEKPGQVFHLPFTWPEPPKEVKWHPPETSPIVKEMVEAMRKAAAESRKGGKS